MFAGEIASFNVNNLAPKLVCIPSKGVESFPILESLSVLNYIFSLLTLRQISSDYVDKDHGSLELERTWKLPGSPSFHRVLSDVSEHNGTGCVPLATPLTHFLWCFIWIIIFSHHMRVCSLFFKWRIIALQCCVSFHHTTTWINRKNIHIPSL